MCKSKKMMPNFLDIHFVAKIKNSGESVKIFSKKNKNENFGKVVKERPFGIFQRPFC